MEGGSWAAGGGGHVLGAASAHEPRALQQEGKEAAGAASERKRGSGAGGGGGGGVGMKFRVRARAPHGVGALLLIGGAAVVGAAVLAWRRSRRGNDKGGAADQPAERGLPAKEEALDGGIVEDGKVQGGSLLQKLDQSDDNLSAGNTDTGSGRLDDNVLEGSHQIHKDGEITTDQLESKHEEKIDEKSSSNNPVEVQTDDLESKHEEKIDESSGRNPFEVHTYDLDKEHVEEIEQKSSYNHVEITAHDMCQDDEHVEKIDHIEGIDKNSIRNPVKIIMHEIVNNYLVSGSVEKVEKDSSKKDIEKEIVQKDNKDMEASGQRKLCISGPGIILSKHNDESDGIQEAESMENTPTAQLMMHQDQLLDDDMVTDTVTETEDTVTETEDIVTETEDTVKETEDTVAETKEAKQGERKVTDESELGQDEKKDLVGLVELANSPALSASVKPTVKKELEFPRPNEAGMKIEQDYTNGELREHTDLISKGGARQGEGDIATMDYRSSILIILALIFALTMGITIVVRLYAPSRATKLQMDLP